MADRRTVEENYAVAYIRAKTAADWQRSVWPMPIRVVCVLPQETTLIFEIMRTTHHNSLDYTPISVEKNISLFY